MAKKVETLAEPFDISQVQAMSGLMPINNSLYSTSEHLEPLIAILLASTSRAAAESAISSCSILIEHLVATSTELKRKIDELGTSLKPTEPKPPATH